jgi:hypothetical protein
MSRKRYTCPCCGYQTFDESPGSYAICHVCFWEDDPVQILDPWFSGGANRPSLVDAQRNYQIHGAMESRFVGDVSGIQPDDQRDPEWRFVETADRASVRVPRDLTDAEAGDLSVWYYWRHRNA